MNLISPPSRTSGFRMSSFDALILLLGGVLSWWLRNLSFPLWWIVPMVLGHFFLFCNVFLVWRRLEFLWAGLFVLNVGAHHVFGVLDWISPMLSQLPVTLLVIIWQIRSPWYHGILASQMNTRLNEYLNAELI